MILIAIGFSFAVLLIEWIVAAIQDTRLERSKVSSVFMKHLNLLSKLNLRFEASKMTEI